uniref:Uncharacterized protein n=1 Tax=Lygus hesperus TaxID=30085 RepID=A0A0A9Y4C7_LYGHE
MGNMFADPYPRPRGGMFTVKQAVKNYGILPLYFVSLLKMAEVPFFTAQAIRTKDITYDRHVKPVNERMDLLHPYHLKLYWINEEWRPRDDLHEAYTALRKAQHKAEAEAKAHMKKPKHSG